MPLWTRMLPALALTLLLSGTPAALADDVSCGMSVVSDITLTEDLSCAGDGLVVATGGVTIDLGGHTLEGSSTGVGIGVYDFEATIRNGTIDGFEIGVAVREEGRAEISRVDVVHNSYGIGGYLWYPYYSTAKEIIVRESRLNHNGVGIALSTTSPMQVISSELSHNGTAVGLLSWDGPGLIQGSRLTHNGIAVYGSQADDITIADSIISDNGEGLLLGMCFDASVLDSTIRSNGTGIEIIDTENDRALITGNRIEDNLIGVRLGNGITWSGPGTVIAANTFRGNGAAGLLIDLDSGWVDGMRVADNTFVRNGFMPDGTLDSAGQLVDDGVHIVVNEFDFGGITFVSNRAHANADYGIEAEGVIDGSENVGWGNTNPRQCLGVSCRDHVAIQLMRMFRPI